MMKRLVVLIVIMAMPILGYTQDWMTDLNIAKRLASIQNKMLFMMWEESTYQPLPVFVEDLKGKKIFIENMFENEAVNQLIWDHFVPVIVNESQYAELYDQIDGKRSKMYMDKFNDDSIKIMDVNGNILNSDLRFDAILNLSRFIREYYLDTSFLKGELSNYTQQKDFNTAFRLASKYIDTAIFFTSNLKLEMIDLSTIYIDETARLLDEENPDNKVELQQKLDLLKVKQDLVLYKRRKVLRQLKKIEQNNIYKTNEYLVAFLYFSVYVMLEDEQNASQWRSQLSPADINKTNAIKKGMDD
ncbi:hypothetical protein SAMN04515667_1265 [Formosa sp. Hel1_31_208]|uniref:hypothetical protein n=1 Tax=Formosa sp. Hel1_31_208 TaxID=1798225 RepID=UPI00087AB40C|nr:hypothetical protein [Formosa sp. Hel1_31_208]SDS03737.1 hypothetical protein SAMN04515667_1265 [Formosa sp. Hel1_31_208]